MGICCCLYFIMTTPAPSSTALSIDFVPLDVLYDQSEWALGELHDRANAIDTKCAAAFTSSSFLLAGMSALQVAFAAHTPPSQTSWWELGARVLGGMIALLFLLVVVTSGRAMLYNCSHASCSS